AVSHLVDDRATSMWRLGIARPRVRLVVILETLVLAAIGALVGLLTWWLVVPHRTSLPLSDTVLVPGSLYLPWAVVVATVATLVGTSIATAGLGRVGSKPLREPGRRVVTVAGIGHLVGWTVMFLSQPLGQRWGSDGLVVVLAVGFAATVVTFPLAVASASRLLARIPAPVSPAMWTSWQQLRRRPRLLSRPSAQAGLLILVTASAFAIAKGVPTKILHSPWEHEQRSVSLVAWQEGSNFEFTLPTSKDIAVAPVVRGGGGVVLTDCPTALRFVGLDATTRCGSGDLPDDVRATLQEWDLAVFDGQPVPNAVWVSTPTSWSQADVLSLASGAPAVIVEQKVGPVPFSRMTADWVLATWFLGSLVLFAALVRAVGDHLSRSVHEGAILDRIGLSRREVDRVLVSSTLLPLGPSLALAAVGTIIFALRGEGVGYTVASFSIIAAALLGGALLLITMVAAAVHLRTSGRRG
ncbi:MAG: hypothetical protein Q4P07_14240, partial [Ornithinimicrobium sp.]|uniref:hypothetical protein n=1 Tax=Ornithinimicrobium sp. TaxID=1977084 RepID=UPI0026E04D76